jgi:hypothetical protein
MRERPSLILAFVAMLVLLVGLAILHFAASSREYDRRVTLETRIKALERQVFRICTQAKGQIAIAQHWADHDPVRSDLGKTLVLSFAGVIGECTP